jgi:hypothetical protein
MPCANDDRWVSMCHIASRHSKIMDLSHSNTGPFVFEMKDNRQFYPVKLP